MTVENPNVRNTYGGNGSTTVFPFTFALNSEDVNNVEVVLTDTEGREARTTDFALSLNDKSVRYPKNAGAQPLPRGWKITLKRSVPYTQPLNLTSQGPFFAEDIEGQFDRQEMQIQQLAEVAERSVTVGFGADMTPEQFKQKFFDASKSAVTAANEARRKASEAAQSEKNASDSKNSAAASASAADQSARSAGDSKNTAASSATAATQAAAASEASRQASATIEANITNIQTNVRTMETHIERERAHVDGVKTAVDTVDVQVRNARQSAADEAERARRSAEEAEKAKRAAQDAIRMEGVVRSDNIEDGAIIPPKIADEAVIPQKLSKETINLFVPKDMYRDAFLVNRNIGGVTGIPNVDFAGIAVTKNANKAYPLNENGNVLVKANDDRDVLFIDESGHIRMIVARDGIKLLDTPTAPTAVRGTDSKQIATTAFVAQAIAALVSNLETPRLIVGHGFFGDYKRDTGDAIEGNGGANVNIGSWYGIGFYSTYNKKYTGSMNLRTGDWRTLGKIRADQGFVGDLAGTADNANKLGGQSLQWIVDQINAANTGIVAGSLTQNGWVKFANGFIVQWGVGAEVSGEKQFDITLPISFQSACFSVSVTVIQSGGVSSSYGEDFQIVEYNRDKIKLFLQHFELNSKPAKPLYIAIGA